MKRISALSRPLRSEGVLEFRRPDFLAKYVAKPVREDYLIDGENVIVEKPIENKRVEFKLPDYPVLEAFATSIRAPLSGDMAALARYWKPSLGGSAQRWTLVLVPIEREISAVIRTVSLKGSGDRLSSMIIEETGGDSSTLSFSEAR